MPTRAPTRNWAAGPAAARPTGPGTPPRGPTTRRTGAGRCQQGPTPEAPVEQRGQQRDEQVEVDLGGEAPPGDVDRRGQVVGDVALEHHQQDEVLQRAEDLRGDEWHEDGDRHEVGGQEPAGPASVEGAPLGPAVPCRHDQEAGQHEEGVDGELAEAHWPQGKRGGVGVDEVVGLEHEANGVVSDHDEHGEAAETVQRGPARGRARSCSAPSRARDLPVTPRACPRRADGGDGTPSNGGPPIMNPT